jgi:tetratricopeptide (TPR) repeat protein
MERKKTAVHELCRIRAPGGSRHVTTKRNLFPIIITLVILGSAYSRADKEEPWLEVRSPHFTVISNSGEKQARRAAGQFEQFRNVIETSLPRVRVDPNTPLVIFAVKDEDSLKLLLPQFRDRLAWTAGIFQPSPEKNYVALRLNVNGERDYHVIYHEYVHALMQINLPGLPLWLGEGLAEFFARATLSDRESGIGRPSPEHLRTLKEAQPLPLEVLLSADQSSPYYSERDKVSIFYAQSWALTHYLMLGDKGVPSRKLSDFLELIRKDVPGVEAASRAFGDLKQLEKQLAEYIRLFSFRYLKIGIPILAAEKQYPIRPLSTAELLAERGEFYVHTARLDEARAALEEALRIDSQNPAANRTMGLLCMRLNDPGRAEKYLSVAASLDPGSFLVHYYLGQAAFERSGRPQIDEAEAHLRRAIEINPQFAAACLMLSSVLAMKGTNLVEALEFATRAAELEPGVPGHHLNLARILMVMQRMDEAVKLGERVVASSTSEQERAEARSFLLSVRDYQAQMSEAKRREEELKARVSQAQQQVENVQAPGKEPKEAAPRDAGSTSTAALDGLVRAVTCAFPSVMDLILEAGGKQYRFHTDDFYAVQYAAADKPGRSDFQPCKELEGLQVRLEYVPTPGREYLGEIKSVLIRK